MLLEKINHIEANQISEFDIHLEMTTAEGKEVTRDIDITNIMVQDGEVQRVTTSKAKQQELLQDWIEYRGNEQHATKLTLVAWSYLERPGAIVYNVAE